MTLHLYAVRCNFLGTPERERLWHAWYDGPKIGRMLALPHFLSVQRFVARALDTRRKYLALWLVSSPEAFESAEYRAQWGFDDWTTEVGDWSRDLYRAPDEIEDVIEIEQGASLYVAAADGMSVADCSALMGRLNRRVGVLWLEAVGLDRYAPLLGLARMRPGQRPPQINESGLVESLFEPITNHRSASFA